MKKLFNVLLITALACGLALFSSNGLSEIVGDDVGLSLIAGDDVGLSLIAGDDVGLSLIAVDEEGLSQRI
ncbi:hypothetical protein [Effusibacillus lacus]|uniref:Uncharacterized protein n=1 Tax=Effusibacillus lacus TaxID=1348429 RepID=A0A292YJF1_9BACL|nr:hypothetical protein [Effusibacillus lacus]TCS75078.1 hypothetical protein EDD64_1093 [Effusibacillus lacus]GAX89031.1 hypothetical protein EFBL_0645 [Effusibacillus lacus]